MRRSILRNTLIAAGIALTTWACGSTPTTPTTSSSTTTTTASTSTDTFTGTLNANGAFNFSFVAATSGAVTATLTSLGPDSPIAVGVSLGTWNGTACTVV